MDFITVCVYFCVFVIQVQSRFHSGLSCPVDSFLLLKGQLIRVMAIKKSTLGAPFFQRPFNCRVVCGTPFLKNIWVPIFSKNLPGIGSMYHTFFPLRSPTFCHILRVPGGVRHPSFVFIRQRVQAPGRSPCIIIRQRVREPGRSRIDHPTFTSGHRLVPYLQI